MFPIGTRDRLLHRDTAHLHAHIWLDARQTDGRKVHLGWRGYRTLDEVWNRLYAQALGQDERTHLQKKEETRAYRRHCREGTPGVRPTRAARRGIRRCLPRTRTASAGKGL